MIVYQKADNIWVVGYYNEEDEWIPMEVYDTRKEADESCKRTNYPQIKEVVLEPTLKESRCCGPITLIEDNEVVHVVKNYGQERKQILASFRHQKDLIEYLHKKYT